MYLCAVGPLYQVVVPVQPAPHVGKLRLDGFPASDAARRPRPYSLGLHTQEASGSGRNIKHGCGMESVENVGEFTCWVSVGVLLLGILGVLWAPFAAAICAFVARIRRVNGPC